MSVARERADGLAVQVFRDRRSLGVAAAATCARAIQEIVRWQGSARITFASAPSQNEFLDTLVAEQDVPWDRVTVFHMDEYVGLSPDHPRSFSRYLREKLPTSVAAFHEIRGDAADLTAECRRHGGLLTRSRLDLCCLGIGENGHLAFNDPSTADFNDPFLVKVVELELRSRQQQVNDGCFSDLGSVPTHAVTLTIPEMLSVHQMICVVPGSSKATAVRQMLEGEISEHCPALALRLHAAANLFLDRASARLVPGLET